MALNITAERKVDLSDFGEGWEDCYLVVKTMNMKQVREWQESLKAATDDAATDLYTEKLKSLLVGGRIMNTNSEGVAEPYMLQTEDIPDVIEQIGPVYQQRALMTASGTYGLKGL